MGIQSVLGQGHHCSALPRAPDRILGLLGTENGSPGDFDGRFLAAQTGYFVSEKGLSAGASP